MAQPILDDSKEFTSARALKKSVQSMQAHDTHLRLFMSFGQLIYEQGWVLDTSIRLLQSICTLSSATHALIATENAGKLIIYNQIGQTLPIGTRIPMMGILASMLKNPVQFILHENKGSPLWTHNNADLNDCLIPIALAQQGKGVIALSGKKLTLGDAEVETLQALAGLVALAITHDQSPARSDADQSILETLTPREREIFALLPKGYSNNELGAKLGIAPGTAKIHVERVLSKLGVRDRTQAAVKAVEFGY